MKEQMKLRLKLIGKITTWVSALSIMTVISIYISHKGFLEGAPFLDVDASNSLRNKLGSAEDWSAASHANGRAYADSIGSSAFILIHEGSIVAEWGETSLKSSVHSIRKSLVSALYGIAVRKGLVDTNSTLAELGVDDKEPKLNKREKSAKIIDLLTATSGIYHNSVKADQENFRPERGSHQPGKQFFYNNWSFNALGGIFEKQTGFTLGQAFKEWIADPIGMTDFREDDVIYTHSNESVFPAYRFWLSSRDLALFGVLFSQFGQWNGQNIIEKDWIIASTKTRTDFETHGYGLMWWTWPDSVYLASGTGGQKLLVDQARNLVVVNKVNTGKGLSRAVWWAFGHQVNNKQFRGVIDRVYSGAPSANTGKRDSAIVE